MVFSRLLHWLCVSLRELILKIQTREKEGKDWRPMFNRASATVPSISHSFTERSLSSELENATGDLHSVLLLTAEADAAVVFLHTFAFFTKRRPRLFFSLPLFLSPIPSSGILFAALILCYSQSVCFPLSLFFLCPPGGMCLANRSPSVGRRYPA